VPDTALPAPLVDWNGYEAVLFDLDGVLTATARLHAAAWTRLFDDYLALRDVLEEVDFNGFAIVEQDMYPAPFDKPLPIAKRTRAYLREIGMG